MSRNGVGSTVDAVVIGGGIVGVSAAAYLAAQGRRVALVERTEIAAGASGRNSGVVQHPFDPILVDLHIETLALYRGLEGLSLPTSPVGLLNVTHDVGGARRLTADLQATHPHLGPSFVSPDQMHSLEPAVAPGVAACRLDIGYTVGPAAATRSYADWARRLGVEIRLGSPAGVWRDEDRAAGVTLESGDRIAAGEVVVAAGPWTPSIVDPHGGWRPIRPNWGVVVPVHLADPPRHVLEEAEISIEPGAASEDMAIAFSLVTADGASSLGSTFLEDEPDAEAVIPTLVRHGATFVPSIATAPRGRPRRCARPLSIDGRPLVGGVPGISGLWVAAGHGPWGISTGPGSGRLVADLVDGRVAAPPPALDPARFGAPSV
ncbi:MAG TPA: FAD-dependent oxidoreductase [Candidatus Limnocylindrales bacterium]|nr:FAD-dependent oxidoreductase [Candidatus Limnocylindrales bacterium]